MPRGIGGRVSARNQRGPGDNWEVNPGNRTFTDRSDTHGFSGGLFFFASSLFRTRSNTAHLTTQTITLNPFAPETMGAGGSKQQRQRKAKLIAVVPARSTSRLKSRPLGVSASCLRGLLLAEHGRHNGAPPDPGSGRVAPAKLAMLLDEATSSKTSWAARHLRGKSEGEGARPWVGPASVFVSHAGHPSETFEAIWRHSAQGSGQDYYFVAELCLGQGKAGSHGARRPTRLQHELPDVVSSVRSVLVVLSPPERPAHLRCAATLLEVAAAKRHGVRVIHQLDTGALEEALVATNFQTLLAKATDVKVSQASEAANAADQAFVASHLADVGGAPQFDSWYSGMLRQFYVARAAEIANQLHADTTGLVCGATGAGGEDGGVAALAKQLEIRQEQFGECHTSVGAGCSQLGRRFSLLGDYSHAIGMHAKALAIDSALGEDARVAESCEALGAVHFEQGDLTTCIDYLKQALAVRVKLGHPEASAAKLYVDGAPRPPFF